MKRAIKDWLIVLASLLDDAAVALLVLLVLRILGIPISLPIIVFLVLLFAVYAFLMHKAVLPALHRRKITGAEGMIGLKGKVIEPLAPTGTVRIGDEYWKAKSVAADIKAGDEVEVVRVDGLTLIVKPKER